jgi:hypothetical protein
MIRYKQIGTGKAKFIRFFTRFVEALDFNGAQQFYHRRVKARQE